MTFPTGTSINTTNLDSPSDDPSLARADLYNLVVAVNSLIASANSSQGLLVLDGSGKVDSTYLPTVYSVTGNIQLQPSTGLINVRNVLRMYQISTVDLGTVTGTSSPQAGDMVYLTDGDAGTPCLSVYDGTNWRVVRLMTTVGDVGATFTVTATLTATATP